MSDNPSAGSQRSALPSTEFKEYCDAEFERRRNSGEDFDEAAYICAMEVALVKLTVLEEEGLA